MADIRANTDLKEKGAYALTNIEAKCLGIHEEHGAPFVVLKYFDSSHQCFSTWSKESLSSFTSFIDKLSKVTWNDIYKSAPKGSNGKKTSFGYTVHKDKSVLPNQTIVKKLSEDLTFFELRVSQEARVHGFRAKSAFFLIWLDQNHEVYK